MRQGFIIAIDGPLAVGKGTIAKLLAQRLDAFYLYTGAFYRCIALFCIENGVDSQIETQVEKIAREIKIRLISGRVYLNDKDVTQEILRQDIASCSSQIAVYPKVRAVGKIWLRRIAQEKIRKGKIVITEGRDTGTAIFPDAKIKIFLTADIRIRTARRLKQLQEKGDTRKTFSQVLQETEERDRRDSERKIDPLVLNPEKFGYTIFDNSNLTEKELLSVIEVFLKQKNIG